MTKIYIAGRFSRINEFRRIAVLLRDRGYQITSQWLEEDVAPDHTMSDITPEYAQESAYTDLADIDRADTLLFFSVDPLVGTPRGGRHVEFGYALAQGLQVIVIGPRENIFHYFDNIRNYPTMDAFLRTTEN